MRLRLLELQNFRNHRNLQFFWKKDNNIMCIVGQNAQGKTNILEAVYSLAISKSFRTSKREDLIGWGEEYGRVKGEIQLENGENVELELFMGHSPHPSKAFKKNGVKISTEDFIGTFKVVMFHPEDLNMLYLGPDLRRKYLDILNIQISKSYFLALHEYKKILQQRNALLKNIKAGFSQKLELKIWDEPLVKSGLTLILERSKTVAFLQTHASEYYQKIAHSSDKVVVEYSTVFSSQKNDEEQLLSNTPEELEQMYYKELEKSLSKDLAVQYTTVGPHRDDLVFHLNGRSLNLCASRGEYRSLLLALKLLELKCIEEVTHEKPVLLLDDVFSELDFSRQEMLLTSIQKHQSIITTTHVDNLSNFKEIEIFEVSNGELLPKNA